MMCGQAVFTRDLAWLVKMSPYVEVTIGKKTLRTKPDTGAGKIPSWMEERIIFEQVVDAREISFKVKHYELYGDDQVVGEAKFSCADFKENKETFVDVPILYKGKHAGDIAVLYNFNPC